LFTQANTYAPVDCTAGLTAEPALRLYPALALSPKLTDRTKTAPAAIPARATTDMARVLDFMIILPSRRATPADNARPRIRVPARRGSLPVTPPVPSARAFRSSAVD
jgi:hypothetical protein